MTRLIVTTDSSIAGAIQQAAANDIPDFRINFEGRLCHI